MAYTAYSIPSFGKGLDLRSQPDSLDPSAAIDCLNVEFSETGAIRQRDGYARLNPFALTNQPDSLCPFYKTDGTKRLLVGNGNRIDVLDQNGGQVANTTQMASPHWFARYGGPTGERVYFGNGTDTIRRYDTTTGFTSPAALAGQTGRFLAVWQNRLVAAREAGTTAGNNPSSVAFSATGDPENFTPAVYVDLHPGDGEQIMGMAVYRDQLVVFKETKFFVFYGIGTNADGSANPQWRPVEAGVGLAASKALTTGRDGIYLMGRDGVYRTSGQDPQIVSGNVEPFFTGQPSVFFRGGTLNDSAIGGAAMVWHRERIYLSVPTGVSTSNDAMLVFDPRYGWWSYWDIPATTLASWRVGAEPELVFGLSGANARFVCRSSPSYSSDNTSTGAPTVANLIDNPSFETGTSNWSPFAISTVPTVARTATGYFGTWALQATHNGGGYAGVQYDLPGTTGLLPSSTYAASIWIQGIGPAIGQPAYLEIQARNAVGNLVVNGTGIVTLTAGWQRLIASPVITQPTTLDAVVRVYVNYNGAGTAFRVDGGQLEVGSEPSPYRDGSTPGYAWEGTPNASRTLTATLAGDASTIVSRYRSGWQDMGQPNDKTVRETRVWGEGRADVRLTTDFSERGRSTSETFTDGNLADVWTEEPTDVWTTAATDVWGGARQIKPHLVRQAARGTVFSVEFSNDQPGQSFAIHRLDHHIREQRIPSVTQTEVSGG